MNSVENHGLISVIIPIYNVESYLQRCLDSIYRNTYKNLEIICVNDGSTDNSLEILKSQQDERVIIIDKENGGVSSARNAGLKIAKGEYIAFVDPDDWVHSRYFELLYSSISECEMAICYHENVTSYINEKPIGNLDIKILSSLNGEIYTLLGEYVFVWGKLYKREIISDILFDEDLSIVEDRIFNIEVFNKMNFAVIVSSVLYYHQSRACSLSHTSVNMPIDAVRKIFLINSKIKSSPILHQTYRMILACRYLHMFRENAKEISLETNEMLRACRIDAKSLLTLKEKLLYDLLARFPFLYRLWRISGDPTLLDWEKSEKKKGDRNCR